jgi:Spy/CpxP family protein refolding chaperone
MTHLRSPLVLVMALVFGATFVSASAAEGPGGSRRGMGRGMGMSRGGLLGLLMMEQVQKDLKLSEDQVAKVNTISEELRGEMRQEYGTLREIQEPEKRRAKMAELSAKFDRDSRTKLADVLNKEQMSRLDQIQMQVRPAAESLTEKEVADKLKLTDEQKQKLEQINKDMQAKQSELFRSMREASREQRTEASQKMRKIRSDTDKQALDVLTAQQKEEFEKMKGKKIELQMERRRGGGQR